MSRRISKNFLKCFNRLSILAFDSKSNSFLEIGAFLRDTRQYANQEQTKSC